MSLFFGVLGALRLLLHDPLLDGFDSQSIWKIACFFIFFFPAPVGLMSTPPFAALRIRRLSFRVVAVAAAAAAELILTKLSRPCRPDRRHRN
eukprot:CAMPEP_0197522408 /NCGR_PEP_ID=MMETSP1318-20131121/7570_1 /TAXON_ID=552666 /ORGANISM="Partenskyella glossopodia, Strain RCC365" /LENGTH=91 /DNA_ID=CAMNT_0043074789 /DNA_START=248 /DNA_END=523 /DNA_ORIENTATION=-